MFILTKSSILDTMAASALHPMQLTPRTGNARFWATIRFSVMSSWPPAAELSSSLV